MARMHSYECDIASVTMIIKQFNVCNIEQISLSDSFIKKYYYFYDNTVFMN